MRSLSLAIILVIVGACGDATPATPVTTSTTTIPSPTTVTTEASEEFEPWALVVVGDYGDGGDAEQAVAAAIGDWVGLHPETVAMVTTGDNFYTADVASAWTEPYGWLTDAGLEVWASPGNHDIETPGQWMANVTAFGSFPRWGTRTAGGVTIVLLDSNQVNSPDQQAWLETTASGLDGQPWLAVFHHPWLSCSLHGSSLLVDERWGDLLSQATLVLNGHDHNYQRFRSESGWSIVSGGGGKPLYDLSACAPGTARVAAAEAFHFLTIVGAIGSVSVEAHDLDGAVFDSVVVPTDG